jgi:hypothetical protein
VPAVHTYQRLKPWGSSPLLDPLWSSDRLAIIHDGCEASRPEKIAYIATSDAALESLHVCAQHHTNCGSCEKCVATQVALRNADALDRATTFPDPASLPSPQAMAEPIRAAQENGGSITIPHALAVARYLARLMCEPNAVREVARGGSRLRRRIED